MSTIRTEIYNAIRTAALETFKHVDLWNRNVEFIEEEEPWPTPAVFVEFGTVTWSMPTKEKDLVTDSATVRIHMVYAWADTTMEDRFSMADELRRKLVGLGGDGFGRFRLSETITNHDHEEIVEDIDVYSFKGVMKL